MVNRKDPSRQTKFPYLCGSLDPFGMATDERGLLAVVSRRHDGLI